LFDLFWSQFKRFNTVLLNKNYMCFAISQQISDYKIVTIVLQRSFGFGNQKVWVGLQLKEQIFDEQLKYWPTLNEMTNAFGTMESTSRPSVFLTTLKLSCTSPPADCILWTG
jgi:hypothetical protein